MLSDEEKNVIDLLKNIDKQKCLMLNCPVVKNNIERQLKIIELNRIIRKQSKEIEEYKKQLDLDNECEIALNSKVMDLEKEIEELKDTRSIFNMGRRSYKNEIEGKIKAKLEELKDGTYDAKIVLKSLLEKE